MRRHRPPTRAQRKVKERDTTLKKKGRNEQEREREREREREKRVEPRKHKQSAASFVLGRQRNNDRVSEDRQTFNLQGGERMTDRETDGQKEITGRRGEDTQDACANRRGLRARSQPWHRRKEEQALHSNSHCRGGGDGLDLPRASPPLKLPLSCGGEMDRTWAAGLPDANLAVANC